MYICSKLLNIEHKINLKVLQIKYTQKPSYAYQVQYMHGGQLCKLSTVYAGRLSVHTWYTQKVSNFHRNGKIYKFSRPGLIFKQN